MFHEVVCKLSADVVFHRKKQEGNGEREKMVKEKGMRETDK